MCDHNKTKKEKLGTICVEREWVIEGCDGGRVMGEKRRDKLRVGS